MNLRKTISAAILTLAIAACFSGQASADGADGRTSDEVIKKHYDTPPGYNPRGKLYDKNAMFEQKAAAFNGHTEASSASNFTNSAGSSNPPSSTPSNVSATNNNVSNPSPTTSSTTSSSDGLYLKAELYSIKYIKHKVANDYEGNPCLVYYFTFTNYDAEPRAPFITSIYAYQNGIQCERAIFTSDNEENNTFTKVMQGVSIDSYWAFKLSDMSDVTIEAPEFLRDNKVTQVLHLK